MTRFAVRRQIAVLLTGLLGANLAAWGLAWAMFHDRPVLLSAALLAWVFGLRHAVDADHIAAIDNVVRKLVPLGRRAWDCGLFFALGHSAVVMAMCVTVALWPAAQGVEVLRDRLGDGGTALSAAFLIMIAVANLRTLRQQWRASPGTVEVNGTAGGVMSRVLLPVQRLAGRGWHMLPVGFLFGLGFDTATEVALLALTARQSAAGMFTLDVLVFPALFAAGMILVDTADSAAMTGAYGWASRDPRRKATYNLVITSLSVFAALAVAALELLGLAADHAARLGSIPGVAGLLEALPYLGFVIVAGLLSVWCGFALTGRGRSRAHARGPA